MTETWLQVNDKELYNINNYNYCHITRINTQNNNKYNIGGGVSIFIKNDLIYNKIDTLCMSHNGLLDILTISLNMNNKIVLISGIMIYDVSRVTPCVKKSVLIRNLYSINLLYIYI